MSRTRSRTRKSASRSRTRTPPARTRAAHPTGSSKPARPSADAAREDARRAIAVSKNAPRPATTAKPDVQRWEGEGGRPAPTPRSADPRRELPGFGRGMRTSIRREEEDEQSAIDAAEGRAGWTEPESVESLRSRLRASRAQEDDETSFD
jgi:hypothetical protein